MASLQADGYIEIKRTPAKTETGRASNFWEEKKGKTLEIKVKV